MTNESIDNIKSLLYCALVFYDLSVVNKVLHNNGFFLGLSKRKFIFMLQKDRFISGGDFDQKIQSETFLAMDTDYIGHRCFRFQSPSLTNGKEQLWIFIVGKNRKVVKIVRSKKFLREERLKESLRAFPKSKTNDFDFDLFLLN